jgi:hypothetical protein
VVSSSVIAAASEDSRLVNTGTSDGLVAHEVNTTAPSRTAMTARTVMAFCPAVKPDRVVLRASDVFAVRPGIRRASA